MKRYLILILTLFTIGAFSQERPAIPKLWGTRIHDEANVISEAFAARLEQQLKAHEDSTSNQIALLTIPTLNGYPDAQYTIEVAEEWKLGQEKNDNGVLMLIAIEDRKIRIEVGEGLEGVLPDILCNQIIRNEMAPYFRQNNYEAGIQAGMNAILQAIAGEYAVESKPGQRRRERSGSILPFIVILAIIILISRMRGGGRGGRGRGWSAGSGWLGGGFYGGGFGGGGGGWSGGGGFSGGGGSFGGGGSSGSW